MEQFAARGWEIVPFHQTADVYFINTCTVTGQADRSSRQLIHRARRKSEESVVIAAGCFAAVGAQELAEKGEVDAVLGIREKARPFEYLPEMERSAQPQVHVDADKSQPVRTAVGTRVSGRSRAFLKVQDGCDHACAYCAVTLARGESRSASLEDVRQALSRVKNAGFEEVVITGVDVTAWGQDLEGELDFVTLVEEATAAGLPRVRLSSLEPWEVTPDRVRRLAAIPQWCEHFHLSLQSADPDLLEVMGRRTDLDRLRESINLLLKLRPGTTIGADLIAGFPGESEGAFNKSLAFVEAAPIHYLHVFPYSPRPGTPAAQFPNQVDRETIKRRAEALRSAGRKQKLHHQRSVAGEKDELLVEQDGQTGYTRAYLRARLETGHAPPRSRVAVTITGLDEETGTLHARIDS